MFVAESAASLASEWLAVLDAVDLSLVVCGPRLERILLANREGLAVLATFGGPNGCLPQSLRKATGACASAELPLEHFTQATEVVAPTGQRFYLRARQIREPTPGALVVVTEARLRLADLVELIGRRAHLSRRQAECAALVSQGLDNQEIGKRLGITEGTVRQYLCVIYESLEVDNRTQLAGLVHAIGGADVPSERGTRPRRR